MYCIKNTGENLTWRKSPIKRNGKITSVIMHAGSVLSAPGLSLFAAGRTSAFLKWGPVLGASSYTIQRASDSGFTTDLSTVFTGYANEYNDTPLTPNTTYYYRIKATGSGLVDSAYSTVSATTANINRTFNVITGNTDSSRAFQINGTLYYDPETNDIYTITPGDTFNISQITDMTYVYISELRGTPSEKIRFINDGDVELASGFSLSNNVGIHITGSGPKTGTYGFKIQGTQVWGIAGGAAFSIQQLNSHIEIDYWEADKMGYGVWLKNEVGDHAGDGDCGAQYWYPAIQHDIKIHHFKSTNMAADNAYIGSSDPYGLNRFITCAGNQRLPRPTGLKNIQLHDFIMDQSGRQGVQWGGVASGVNKIYNFQIDNSGQEFNDQQGAAIAIGSASGNIEIYDGTIDGTFRHGIYSYNYGGFSLNNISFTNVGTVPSNTDPVVASYIVKITLAGGTTIADFRASSGHTNPGHVIIPAGSEYSFEVWKIDGNVIELKTKWLSLTPPTVSEATTISNASTTPEGSFDGTYAEPFVGFGASATVTTGEISIPARGGLQYGQSAVMVNPYDGSRDPEPTIFDFDDLNFISYTGTTAIDFNATSDHYGAGNTINACLKNGIPITNSDIFKNPGATTCDWTLT